MDPRLAARDGCVVTFTERGASAHVPANTMEAFELSRKLGADGISTTAWTTADGVAVLSERARIGTRLHRQALASLTTDQLPEGLVTLPALYDRLGPLDLLLEVGDAKSFAAVLEAARAQGEEAEGRLWLVSPNIAQLVEWRTRTKARLVNAVAPRKLTSRPERLAAELRQTEIDALLLFHHEWNGGLVALMHRFDRYALGWGLEHEREIAKAINAGIDGICGAHPDRLAAASQEFYPGR